jgi:hypothetical protein
MYMAWLLLLTDYSPVCLGPHPSPSTGPQINDRVPLFCQRRPPLFLGVSEVFAETGESDWFSELACSILAVLLTAGGFAGLVQAASLPLSFSRDVGQREQTRTCTIGSQKVKTK